jgi:hypothetical protein
LASGVKLIDQAGDPLMLGAQMVWRGDRLLAVMVNGELVAGEASEEWEEAGEALPRLSEETQGDMIEFITNADSHF